MHFGSFRPLCGYYPSVSDNSSLIKLLSCGPGETFFIFFPQSRKRKALLSPLASTIASAVSQNTYTHGCSQTVLTEFSNCPPERPTPLGFRPAGRSALVPDFPAHTHLLTAMPQRYSHQRRKASTAATRRMERRHRDQGKNMNNNPTSSHNHRSKKLAMLSRYQY